MGTCPLRRFTFAECNVVKNCIFWYRATGFIVQWNLYITNLNATKSSVRRIIFITTVIVKHMKKNLDKTKPPYREHIQLSVSWLFVISRFHYISNNFQSTLYSPRELLQRPKGTFWHKYCRLVCWDKRRA